MRNQKEYMPTSREERLMGELTPILRNDNKESMNTRIRKVFELFGEPYRIRQPRKFRCFGCRRFWGRCFRRFGRGLGRGFRGGR